MINTTSSIVIAVSLLIALNSDTAYSQISADDFQYSGVADVSLPSPAAASLGKYGEIPVSYSTGVPSIDIPLYNLSFAQVTVPISLSYHAAGIKASERSGPVGLGWSLNAGGVITRVVRGYPDEVNDGVISGYYSQLALMESLAPIGTTSAADKDYLFKAAEGKYDSEPDLYYYNFAGRSGFMVINSSNGNPSTTEFVSFPDQDLNITFNGSNWSIWDTDGTRYFFEIKEQTESSNNYDAEGSNSIGTIVREVNEAPYISSWYLESISHPSNNPVSPNNSFPRPLVVFEYEKIAPEGPLEVFSGSSISISKKWDDPSQSCLESTYSQLMVNQQNNTTIKETSTTDLDDYQRLTKIVTDEHIIKFTYTDGISNNYPLGYRLDRILVTKRDGTVPNTNFPLKDYNLNYGSFTAGTESLLKLNSISESVLGTNNNLVHSFEYESGSLVSRTDKSLDWLGYPTGRSFGSNDYLIDNDAEFFSLPYPNGVNREPVFNETKIGVLKKITYPTGGFTEFTYELNTAEIDASVVDIGGLRVQKITSSNDGTNTGFLEKTYAYSGGVVPGELEQLISLGYQLLETSTYYPIQGNTSTTCPTMSVTSNLVTPLMGHFVSYETVTETIDGGSGGKTEYEFEEYGYGGSSSVNHADNYYRRSLPKRTTQYNSTNQKIQQIENYYTPQTLTENEIYWVRPRVKLNPKLVGGVVQYDKEYQPVYDGYFKEYFPNLYKTEVRTFNGSSTTNVVAKTEYYYDQTPDHFEVTKKVLTNSDGEQAEYRYKYANEEYSEMRDENMLVQPYSIELIDPDNPGIQRVAKRWFTWKDFNSTDNGGWNIENVYDLEWNSNDYTIETLPANRSLHVNLYNDLGIPTEVVDAVGNTVKYYFGSKNQPFSQNGYDFYQGNYNLKNIYLTGIQKIIGSTDAISGGVRPTSGNDLFTEAFYDDYGRLIELLDENSNKSEFLYDEFSRLISTIRANKAETFHRYYYSPHGNGGSYNSTDPNSISTLVSSTIYEENIIASNKSKTFYDGTNDVTNFGDINSFDTPDAFTVSLWFKRDDDNSSETNHQINNVLVANSSEGSNDNLEIGTDGSLVEIYLDTGTNSGGQIRDARVEFDAGIQDGIWYHLIVTYDHDAGGPSLNLYLNGEHKKGWDPFNDGVLFTSPLEDSNGSPLTLGLARPNVDKWGDFEGEILDFRLYDREFSETELRGLYLQNINYFDGLGFEIQNQRIAGDETIVTGSIYNDRGYPIVQSRPALVTGVSGFIDNLFSGTGTFTAPGVLNSNSKIQDYWDNAGNLSANDANYAYSYSQYESNPIARSLSTTIPGYETRSAMNRKNSTSYELNSDLFSVDGQNWQGELDKTIKTNPDGENYIIHSDAWGRNIISGVDMSANDDDLIDSEDIVNKFVYDLRGNITKMINSNGEITTYSYDEVGQLITKNLPDQSGIHNYRYDAHGRLRFHKDPNLDASNDHYYYTKYDELDRVTEYGKRNTSSGFDSYDDVNNASFPSSSNTFYIKNEYDGTGSHSNGTAQNLKGRLTKTTYRDLESDDFGYTWYSYDEIGNIEWVIKELPNSNIEHTISYEYDDLSKPIKVSYSSDSGYTFFIWYEYDAFGRLEFVYSNLEDDISSRTQEAEYIYNVEGKVTKVNLGIDAQSVDYSYNGQGWLSSINDPDYFPTPQNGSYPPDRFGMELKYYTGFEGTSLTHAPGRYNGNVVQVKWEQQLAGTSTDEPYYNYTYDKAGRLTNANYDNTSNTEDNSSGLDAVYTYDEVGNIQTIDRRRGNSGGYYELSLSSSTYQANTNKLTNFTLKDGPGYSTNYTQSFDENGNVESNSYQKITSSEFDWRNLPIHMWIDGDEAYFGYDENGKRIREQYDVAGTTYSVRGTDGVTIAAFNENWQILYFNILANGEVIGQIYIE